MNVCSVVTLLTSDNRVLPEIFAGRRRTTDDGRSDDGNQRRKDQSRSHHGNEYAKGWRLLDGRTDERAKLCRRECAVLWWLRDETLRRMGGVRDVWCVQ